MWRHWGGGNGGSRQFLSTASDWKDPATYIQHNVELFPDLGAAGTEDQFLYADEDGNYHAVFHHMYGTGTKSQWWLDATGGHAFSKDGWTWTYTGACTLVHILAPLRSIQFSSSVQFTRAPQDPQQHLHTHIHAHTHTHTHTHIHACMYTHMHTCAHTSIDLVCST